VPPRLRAEIEREHGRLMLVGEQLAKLKKPSAPALLTPAAAEMARRKDMLLRVKSLGPAFSSRLVNEVFYKDFRNRREVGGYFGLGGSPWCSGETNREQGISKAGNRRARHTAVELSWLWLIHQPDSALTRWYRERTANASKRIKRIKRITIVALAQADGGVVALSHDRPDPGRRGSQRLSTECLRSQALVRHQARPSRPLRSACGGGLRPALTACSCWRPGLP
jgi:hypothetical protein